MLFWLPPVCTIVLGVIYVFITEASAGSKLLVAALVIASFGMNVVFPGTWLIALIMQVIISIAILLYLKVNR